MEGYQNTSLLQESVPDPYDRLSEISLSPGTVLELAPNFRTRLDAAGHVMVDSPAGTVVDIGPRGFAILSMFSRPVTLGDALDRLEAEFGGSTDFAPTMSVVNMLIEENTLVAVAAGHAPTTGWADPIEHARMLHDDRRTRDFISVLTAAVQPDDVVLDIGTGSGVLAIIVHAVTTFLLRNWFGEYGHAYGGFGISLALVAFVGLIASFWVWIAAVMGVYWERKAGPAAVAKMEELSAEISTS